jgi:hypothetical protein
MQEVPILTKAVWLGIIVACLALVVVAARSRAGADTSIPGYEPLGCGQNVHSYAIAREC